MPGRASDCELESKLMCQFHDTKKQETRCANNGCELSLKHPIHARVFRTSRDVG